jgi:hypothetical protein
MNIKSYDKWRKSVKNTREAREWNDLPNGSRYQNDTFSISPTHSKAPVFVRCGQQHHAGQNYWNSPKEFNDAVMEYLIENFDTISSEAIKRLEQKESEMLKGCKEFVEEMKMLLEATDDQQ